MAHENKHNEDWINAFEVHIYDNTDSVSDAHAKMAGIYHSWIGSFLDCLDCEDFELHKEYIINKLKEKS